MIGVCVILLANTGYKFRDVRSRVAAKQLLWNQENKPPEYVTFRVLTVDPRRRRLNGRHQGPTEKKWMAYSVKCEV